MEEKMNLSDFTKDGSPVVEQKQEEDAVEEQSTDEVSVRNESETSGEAPQENEEVVEEPTEQGEEEVKEEEEKVEEKVEEPKEIEEESIPQGNDYSQYSDVIDLLEKDDYLKKAVNYYKENGDLRPFLEAFQYDYEKLDDLELLRLKFDGENPELSQKAKDRLFIKEVVEKYKLDKNEEYDEDEVELGQELLKRDASRIRKQLVDTQKDFIPKDQPKPPSEAELKEAVRQQRKLVRDGVKRSVVDNKISIGVGDEKVNFEVSNIDSMVDYAVDTTKFLQKFSDKDGNVDWGLWSRTIAYLENPDGFVKELVNYGKSLGRKSIEAEIKNEKPLVNTKDVKVEDGGQTPYDDKEAFLKYIVENKR